MDEQTFRSKVRELRSWQTKFFKAPHGSPAKAKALEVSKALEREIDQELQKDVAPQLFQS